MQLLSNCARLVGNPETETSSLWGAAELSGSPALLQVSQYPHVSVEAWLAAGEVREYERIGLFGVLSEANQIGIWRTVIRSGF